MNKLSTLILCTAVGIASAGATWLWTARTARAPEPARVTSGLSGPNGPTTAAYSTSAETLTAIKWPATWTLGNPAPEGTFCSPGDLSAWTTTTYQIVISGNYAKCQ
jgi:hypothetical protein